MGDKDNDNAAAKANGDYLGYSVYAEALWSRIVVALDKDRQGTDPLGDDPLVVGIFGEWGAGKSTLLKLVERHATQHAEQRAAWRKHEGGNVSLTVPVFFQPWKYEHEPHLHVPILLHILAALQRHMVQAQMPTEWALDQLRDAITQHMEAVVGAFGKLLAAVAVAMDTAIPLSSRVGVAVAGLLAKSLPKANPEADKEALAKTLEYKENGRFFYEMHETLQAITRPQRYSKNLTGVSLRTEVSINFVIFIDDLDRCLPEKAVEALELIKTIFNLESFAFVLALDEEVVERGIGHRYRDYAMVNKKPEMPITGFEYLEKIVHLPFRLPGLTRDQARQFLERYESSEVAVGKPERWWFAPRPASSADSNDSDAEATRHLSMEQRGEVDADLSRLVLNAFTAYVPRKLVRLVELLHQVQEVASRRGRTLSVGGTNGTDVRVVTALVMLQLFQPDLYRLVRRKPQAFPLLLAAFATRENGQPQIADPAISDLDLWLWVVDESAGEDNDWLQKAEPTKVQDAVVTQIAKIFRGREKEVLSGNVTVFDLPATYAERFRAQNVKLPLVAQIVEHRATHRHAFDPLRLFHALAGALETGWKHPAPAAQPPATVSPAAEVSISAYFELMVARDGADGAARERVRATFSTSWSVQAPIPTQPVRYPDRLFADITSSQPEVQANLVANNELEADKVLEVSAAETLLKQLKEWCDTRARDGTGEPAKDRERLTRGLRVLAPLVPRELGQKYLSLVDDPQKPPFFVPGKPEAFETTGQIREAFERAELWSALGQDVRFDPARFHLPKTRWPTHSPEQEPVAGFVRVPREPFTSEAEGSGFGGNSRNRNASVDSVDSVFYIARYLTTVDQYAHFIAAGGYGEPDGTKPDWWDTLGWQWRIGQWDSQEKNKQYREYLARRQPTLRGAPMQWAEQRAHGSCPVVGLCWFEVRAYVRWLSLQLQNDILQNDIPKGYRVQLPTEAQWEHAARAKDVIGADEWPYPWGKHPPETAHLHANISDSNLNSVSPVGLFAPNPLGLCDLSGNVWEWQNNLYLPDGKGQYTGLVSDVTQMKTHGDWDQSDCPMLRGGSWGGTADDARASFRIRARPDGWNVDLGFRVVLSLASQTSET